LVVCSLHDVIPAALARIANGRSVMLDLPPDLPAITADPVLLEQALVNVLDNAVKHGGGAPVSITAVKLGEQVIARVTDTGPGIDAEHLPHIFDSFYRASRGDRALPGTGLGLAIARGLLEAMGGSIAAQSPRPDAARNENPGTAITLRLPLVKGAQ
jgi:two-component system sensor histidine kinase KdpD